MPLRIVVTGQGPALERQAHLSNCIFNIFSGVSDRKLTPNPAQTSSRPTSHLRDSTAILPVSKPQSFGLTNSWADVTLCWLKVVEIQATFQNAFWAADLFQQQFSLNKNSSGVGNAHALELTYWRKPSQDGTLVNWKTCAPSKETAASLTEFIFAIWRYGLTVAECPDFSREAGNSSFYWKFILKCGQLIQQTHTHTDPHIAQFIWPIGYHF